MSETKTRLPDLPGLVRGIVGRHKPERGWTEFTVQCERCLDIEGPKPMVFMGTHFHSRTLNTEQRRLCPECRRELFAKTGCICDDCGELRR